MASPVIFRFLSLLGGSVAGQVAMIAALPVITYLYEPDEFGMLGAFGALVMLVLPAACLRFDLAIAVPDDDLDARALAALALVSATVFSAAYGGVIYLVRDLMGPEFVAVTRNYGWLIPLTLWAAALFSIAQFWAIRNGLFRELAVAHFSRGVLGAGTQIGLGMAGFGAIGLLLGQAMYMGLGSVALLTAFLRAEFRKLREISAKFLIQTARSNWRFPVFSTPDSLLDSTGAHLPMLVIVYTSGPEIGGLLYLAQRITSIPVGIIGGTLSRVYLGEARNKLRDGTLFIFTLRIVLMLFLASSLPFLGVFFGAPFIFDQFLSREWAESAGIVQMILPAAFIQFCIVPVSTVFQARSKQFWIMLVNASGLLLQVGSILLCHWTGIADPIMGLAVGATVYYSIYALAVYFAARL